MSASNPSVASRTAVIVTLIFIGILVATALIMSLALNMKAFAAMFGFFILTYTSYVFACLLIFRTKLKDDFRYQIALYSTIFCMFIAVSLFVLAFVFKSSYGVNSLLSTPSSNGRSSLSSW